MGGKYRACATCVPSNDSRSDKAAAGAALASPMSPDAMEEAVTASLEEDDEYVPGLPEDVPRRELQKIGSGSFRIDKTVGQGAFGRVFMVTKKDSGKVYAMKVLQKEKIIASKQRDHTLSERRVLAEISSPFLVGLRFAFQTTQKLFMVFDFFNGGELFSYIQKGRFTEARARFYTAELILGVGTLHDHHIVYRDLKPENILLARDGHLKICDFGLVKENVRGDTVSSLCGTPEYVAPEIVRRQSYGKAVDWWSLGTLVWEMVVGVPPFYDVNKQLMFRKILTKPLPSPPLAMSAPAYELCRGLLHRDPKQRLGYTHGAKELMAMSWFKDYNWVKLAKLEMKPPFMPDVKKADDTSAIDSQFLNKPAAISFTPAGHSAMSDTHFQSFTFEAGRSTVSSSVSSSVAFAPEARDAH